VCVCVRVCVCVCDKTKIDREKRRYLSMELPIKGSTLARAIAPAEKRLASDKSNVTTRLHSSGYWTSHVGIRAVYEFLNVLTSVKSQHTYDVKS